MVSWSLTTLSNFCLGWVASPTRNLSSWPGTYTSSGLKKVAESGMAAAGRRSGPASTRLRGHTRHGLQLLRGSPEQARHQRVPEPERCRGEAVDYRGVHRLIISRDCGLDGDNKTNYIIMCPFSVCGPRVRVTPEPPLPVAVSYRDGEEVVAGEGGPAQHHRQPLRVRDVLHTGAQLCQSSKLLSMQAMFDSAVYYSEEAPK